MYHIEFDPPDLLKSTIKCIWYDRIEFGSYKLSHEVTPDGYVEIIFYFGNSCNLITNGKSSRLTSPFLIGLLNKPVTFSSEDTLEIIGIRCYPWTVSGLLNIPADGLRGVKNINHNIGNIHATLSELISMGTIDPAVNLIKEFLINSRIPLPDSSALLYKAGYALKSANGIITVTKVAEAAHASVRTLERNFKQSSGHSVKNVSGLMRFEQVRNRLLIDPACNIAGLAHELGYTDHSHLTKEFKRYSGITPSAFARMAKIAGR
jgi:AraC-like DNA-binding protein